MTPWNMNRLERDLARLGALIVGGIAAVGATFGWVAHQLFHHLHHEGRSDHRRYCECD